MARKSEHERAVAAALAANGEIGKLFDQLGTLQEPSGRVLAAYRQARRALKGNEAKPAVVRQVLADLRGAVLAAVRQVLEDAARLGEKQAQVQLGVWGLPLLAGGYLPIEEERAITTQLDAQLAAVLALSLGGGDSGQILGGEDRAGVLAPAPIVRDASRWVAMATLVALARATDGTIQAQADADEWRRQAVAAIDERTTDCCLRVHGQVTTMDGRFRLEGTPRFADELRAPPFHWYCRTSVAIVRASGLNDDLSMNMRSAASSELAARVDGSRVEIHPAHATSRR